MPEAQAAARDWSGMSADPAEAAHQRLAFIEGAQGRPRMVRVTDGAEARKYRKALEAALRWMYLNSAEHVKNGIPEQEKKTLDPGYVGDIATIRAAIRK